VDAILGRLNETSFLAERTGTFFGQCSEICGLQHVFMSIQVEVVDIENYASHIEMLLNEIEEDLE
jgi:heme/copper-type cytochrome/quinol oxidase subunit 2